MDSDDFGLWAMLAFWASAMGGIMLGISWAKSRGEEKPRTQGSDSKIVEDSTGKRRDHGRGIPKTIKRALSRAFRHALSVNIQINFQLFFCICIGFIN